MRHAPKQIFHFVKVSERLDLRPVGCGPATQQNDPIGFEAGDANLYRFASNRPVGFTDPYGLQETIWRPVKPPDKPKVILGRPIPIKLPPGADLKPPAGKPGGEAPTPARVEIGKPIPIKPVHSAFKAEDYWRWYAGNFLAGLKPEQYKELYKTLNRGCVGLTALALGIKGMPDVSNCYNTLDRAVTKKADMVKNKTCGMKKGPYGGASVPVIFAVRFWSEGKAYKPDANGKVDMTGWKYKSRPKPGGGGYINFDFGWYSEAEKLFTHANHAAPGMEVYIGNEVWFSRPLLDFDKQVYCVACQDWQYGGFATPPKPVKKTGS